MINRRERGTFVAILTSISPERPCAMRQERFRNSSLDRPESRVVFQSTNHISARAKCLSRPRRLSHEGRDRASPTCSSRTKLVQVRVASLSLSIQRGVLEDDLSIFLLFYEPLYHARERVLSPGR